MALKTIQFTTGDTYHKRSWKRKYQQAGQIGSRERTKKTGKRSLKTGIKP